MIQHPTRPAALAVAVPDGIFELGERSWMTPAAFESAENLALIAAYAHHRLTQTSRLCVVSSMESRALPPG
jgi:hypothetical protein